MPFSIIPTVLGVCFVLVWVFIGGMVLRDGHWAARREYGIDIDGRQGGVHGAHRTGPPHWSARIARQKAAERQASAA